MDAMMREADATELVLIRHAQAVVNVEPILGGPKGDRGLTELGRRQASALRDRLVRSGEISPDLLLCSSLPRAVETATIIAPALGLTPIPDDDLQELRVGPEGDGLTLDEYKRRFGWVDLTAEPFRPVDPGGESWATFLLRVAMTLERIVVQNAGQQVAIVTHGGIIDGAFVHFFGMNPHALPPVRFHTQNVSITRWLREWRLGEWHWRLQSYNDHAHLAGLETTPSIDYTSVPADTPEDE